MQVGAASIALQTIFKDLFEEPVAEAGGNGALAPAGGVAPAAEVQGPPPPIKERDVEYAEQQEHEEYQHVKAEITTKFERMEVEAGKLQECLQSAKQQALAEEEEELSNADAEFTPAWRDVGLPMKPSHLQLDHDAAAAAGLLDPKAVTSAQAEYISKEVLQPPRTFEFSDTSAEPHYLAVTGNLKVRQAIAETRKLAATSAGLPNGHATWGSLGEEELARKLRDVEARHHSQSTKMSVAQWDREQKIVESLRQRISFLRNPRFPIPPRVAAVQQQQVGRQKLNWTWKAPAPTVTAQQRRTKARAGGHQSEFIVEPAEIVFGDYEVGRVYERTISLRNVSSVSSSLRLVPPSSQYFHLSLPRFKAINGNEVAPGIAVEVTVRFTPDSLGDYDDCFGVQTPHSSFEVAVAARRPPPALSLPEELHVGEAVVGNRHVVKVPFINNGGMGRFMLVPKGCWPPGSADVAEQSGAVTMGPFQVSPAAFELGPGGGATLTVSFEPTAAATYEDAFMMACDNCTVREFTLRGVGSLVDVHLAQVDHRAVEGVDFGSTLWFGQVVPGSCSRRQLYVRNSTTIRFPFRWQQQQQQQQQKEEVQIGIPTPAAASDLSAPHALAQAHKGANSDHPSMPFLIEPATGTFQPGEVVQFTVTFAPQLLGSFLQRAELHVDRAAHAETVEPRDVVIISTDLEGSSMLVDVQLDTPHLAIAGALNPGESATRTCAVVNNSPAAVQYSFRAVSDGPNTVTVAPATGTVPPMSRSAVNLTFVAAVPGSLVEQLMCVVEHGPVLPLSVSATVTQPRVEVVTTRLDFGLVRIGLTATAELLLRNTATKCAAEWSISQDSAELTSVEGSLEFALFSGILAPGEEVSVGVTFHALREGPQNMRLACRSGGGVYQQFIEVAGVVVVPRVVTDTCRLDMGVSYTGVPRSRVIRLRNLALLPCDFAWSVAQPDDCCTPLHLSVRPATGTLQPGEDVQLRVKLHSNSEGDATAIAVCHVAGMQRPVGLMVTTRVQGLAVAYRVLTEQQWQLHQAAKQAAAAAAASRQVTTQPQVTVTSIYADTTASTPRLAAEPSVASSERSSSHAHTSTSASATSVVASTSAPSSPAKPPPHGDQSLPPPPPPLPGPSEHLHADFGHVPIGDTRQLYLLVRNLTSMQAELRAWLQIFQADHAPVDRGTAQLAAGFRSTQLLASERRASSAGGDGPSKGQGPSHNAVMQVATPPSRASMSPTRRSGSPGPRTSSGGRLRLDDQRERLVPFRAATGNDMMSTRRMLREAEQVLGDKGIALHVSPSQCVLPPWGEVTCQLVCYNNMCGDYLDTLHVQLGELPPTAIPVRVGVVGTPLVVQKERVLIKGLKQKPGPVRVDFGQLPLDAAAARHVFVFNTGSLDMLLTWQYEQLLLGGCRVGGTNAPDASGAAAEAAGPAADVATAASDASGTGDWDGGKQPQPVNNPSAVVLAAESSSLSSHGAVAPQERSSTGLAADAQLTASSSSDILESPFSVVPPQQVIKAGECCRFDIRFRPPRAATYSGRLLGCHHVLSQQEDVQLQLWHTGEAEGPLQCLFSGIFHPHAAKPPLPLLPLVVNLKAEAVHARLEPDANSELLWECWTIHDPASHPSYRHTITLSNTSACPQAFSLSTSGPFSVISATPSVPQEPSLWKGSTALPASLADPTILPPQQTADVVVAFTPPRQQSVDYSLSGELQISYSNGERQMLPLEARVTAPLVMSSQAAVHFGAVHVQSQKSLDVTLTNTSTVDARWAVAAAGAEPEPQELTAAHLASAAPSVSFGAFTLTPPSGTLLGRGIKMPKTQTLRITYAPSTHAATTPVGSDHTHVQEVCIAVGHGTGCRIMLTGSSSVDENTEHQRTLFQI